MATVEPAAAAAAEPKLGPLLGLSALIGIAASLAAVLYISVEHGVQAILWTHLPEQFGWESTPAWWVLLVLVVGALLVWAACRLPGHGGHSPLDPMSFTIDPVHVWSVVLAAMASLAFGAVLGPEAPLMAIGAAMGAVLLRTENPGVHKLAMLAGAVAAMGLILGNPLITLILVLEGAVLKGSPGGKQAMLTIMPVLVALGFGYLTQVGAGDWGGFGESVLAVPGLPAYTEVQLVDLVGGAGVAIVVALLAVAAVRLGETYRERMSAGTLPALLLAAVVVAVTAVVVSTTTGQSVDTILFSGQSAIPEVLTISSVGALIAIALGKALAYAVSLGSGFRGGKIFPAVFLGVVMGVAAASLFDSLNVAAVVAAGIAAGAGAVIRLPVTATLLAVLLCSAAGLAVTTTAIVGAIIGVLISVGLEARSKAAEAVSPTESAPTS